MKMSKKNAVVYNFKSIEDAQKWLNENYHENGNSFDGLNIEKHDTIFTREGDKIEVVRRPNLWKSCSLMIMEDKESLLELGMKLWQE